MYRNKGKMNGWGGQPASIFARRDITTFLQSETGDGHKLMDYRIGSEHKVAQLLAQLMKMESLASYWRLI